MYIKQFISGLTITALMLTTASFGAAAKPAPVKPTPVSIFVNDAKLDTYDTEVKKDLPALIINGRTLMPLKKTFELFGLKVSWDQKSQKVQALTDIGNAIVLQIGNKEAKVGSKAYTLDVAPQVIDGRTYVPVAFVANAVGHPATWDATNKIVKLYTDGSDLINISALPSVYNKTPNRVNGTTFFDGSGGQMVSVTATPLNFADAIALLSDTQTIQSSDFTIIQNTGTLQIARYSDTFGNMSRNQYVIDKNDKVFIVEIRGLNLSEADAVAKNMIK